MRFLLLALLSLAVSAAPRPNILLMTADDMNYDSPGFTGNNTPNITPHLDRLASQSIYFVNAHVAVAVCQPSRECMMTGRYPHHNGATGFYPVNKDVPSLMEILKPAGYHLGILGKVVHLRPAEKFPWHFQKDAPDLGSGRDPALYYKHSKDFFDTAKRDAKPFFLMANSADPHRPFHGSEQETQRRPNPRRAQADNDEAPSTKYPAPQRIYKPDEVSTPAFLPDLPDVRHEVAQYYSSVHRADQTFGQVLKALADSGLEENTIVIFFSDNGISMPFAKSNCYFTSTRTPLLIKWPGTAKPAIDRDHFINTIDLMPTLLELLQLPVPPGTDGRSILPLLRGQALPDRDHVFTCYNETSGRRAYPTRCLQTKQYAYLYNAWSDGKTTYRAEPMNGLAFKAMQSAANTDKSVAARVQHLFHRTPEELYDIQSDPACLNNLASDPNHRTQLLQSRAKMLDWMKQTSDPLLEQFDSVGR